MYFGHISESYMGSGFRFTYKWQNVPVLFSLTVDFLRVFRNIEQNLGVRLLGGEDAGGQEEEEDDIADETDRYQWIFYTMEKRRGGDQD